MLHNYTHGGGPEAYRRGVTKTNSLGGENLDNILDGVNTLSDQCTGGEK